MRFFDILFALFAIILLSPILLLISIILLLKQGKPVFFTQTRVGKDQKKFKIIKFRTMIVQKTEYDSNSVRTIIGDSRITPIGKFLRKTSLDEIPQFLNVLLGDMSLVGPRPDTPFQENDYVKTDWLMRCSVRPGITGYSQIYGRSNLTENSRIQLDLKWVSEKSLFSYFKVIIITPFLMFKNSN